MELDLLVLDVYSLNSEKQDDKLNNVVEYFDPNVVRVESIILVGAHTVIVVNYHVDDEWNK